MRFHKNFIRFGRWSSKFHAKFFHRSSIQSCIQFKWSYLISTSSQRTEKNVEYICFEQCDWVTRKNLKTFSWNIEYLSCSIIVVEYVWIEFMEKLRISLDTNHVNSCSCLASAFWSLTYQLSVVEPPHTIQVCCLNRTVRRTRCELPFGSAYGFWAVVIL